MKKLRYLPFVLLLASCSPELEHEEWSTGDINTASVVYIGGYSVSGYADDAIYSDAQENSFAGIISQQLNLIQDVEYSVPAVASNSVGLSLMSASKLELGYKTDCKGITGLSPVRSASTGDLSVLTALQPSKPFYNLGVPGLSTALATQTGVANSSSPFFNPFFARFASSNSASVLSEAQLLNPTFSIIRLGEDEILNYAAMGATGNAPLAQGPNGVGFHGSLAELIGGVVDNGGKAAIGNIPNVLDFPFFTTIPYDGLELDAANAQTLNQIFNPIGISFSEGPNGFTIEDTTQAFGVRKMVQGELVLLSIPLDSVKCNGMGSIVPIPNKYVLTLDEIAGIKTMINEYNTIIASNATAYGLAHADLNSLYQTFTDGIIFNGVSMSAEFVSGGLFSLDGRNLNPKGACFVANEYIKAINQTFNSNIPLASSTKYRGVIFP